MLTAIIEIILTVKAWKKGWGARALLPMGIGFACAFVLGLVMGGAGASIEAMIVPAILVDVGIIGTLIGMAARAPQAAVQQPESQPVASLDPAAEAGTN